MQDQLLSIEELYRKWVDKKASKKEVEQLFDLLEEKGIDTTLQPLMKARWQEDKEIYPYSDERQDEVLRLIFSKYPVLIDGRPPVHRENAPRRVPTRSWFRYAAAAVITLSLGGAATWWWLVRTPATVVATTNDNKRLESDIKPGSDRAVLTLADGTKITLDNAANGTLVQQGNTKVIKLDNGRLVYNTSPPAPLHGVERGENTPGRVPTEELLYNTISTPRGGQYQIILPDGSKVWLNAASSIKFPTAFAGNSRGVEITGEAYLEVAKNTKQPFIVNTGKTTIQVLGTSFNVNAYADEEAIKTTLVEGSVRVVSSEWSVVSGKRGNRKEEVVLKPGEQADLTHNSQLTTHQADLDQTLAWKNGLFNFNGADLQLVMHQLERWYDVEVVYETNVPKIKFIGKIERDLNLSEVLDILKRAEVHFRIEGKKIIVM